MRAPGHPIDPAEPLKRAESAATAPSADDVVERPVKGPWLQYLYDFQYEWNIARLPFAGLHPDLEGLRIVHITDLHLRKTWWRMHGELKDRLERDPPDLLLVTGDFVDNKRNHEPALPNLYRLLEGFRARLGCYGILGNHDTETLGPRLEQTNVRIIGGERLLVRVGGGTIELIGLPGVRRKHLRPEWVESVPPKRQNPPGTLRVVLSHFPDHLRRTGALAADLFLAGHTHGGQVCLPGMIPIIKHDKLPRRLCSGVHRVEDTWLVVARGLGTTGLPLRVFCPPEVVEIRLKRKT